MLIKTPVKCRVTYRSILLLVISIVVKSRDVLNPLSQIVEPAWADHSSFEFNFTMALHTLSRNYTDKTFKRKQLIGPVSFLI